jgi:hypothetical protein
MQLAQPPSPHRLVDSTLIRNAVLISQVLPASCNRSEAAASVLGLFCMDDWASDQKKNPPSTALQPCWDAGQKNIQQQEPFLLFSRELFYVQSRGAPAADRNALVHAGD